MLKSLVCTRDYIFHYTSLNGFFGIFSSGYLKFSKFKNTNDPRETKDWPFSLQFKPFYNPFKDSIEHKILGTKKDKDPSGIISEVEKYLKESAQVFCFTQNNITLDEDVEFNIGYGHPRMWDQYSSNHRGVCLILNKNKVVEEVFSRVLKTDEVIFENVEYQNKDEHLLSFYIKEENLEKKGFKLYAEEMFLEYYRDYYFRKNKDWMQENEIRALIYRKAQEANEFILPIKDCIEGVILGPDFPEENYPWVKDYCEQFSIPSFSLIWVRGEPRVFEFYLNGDLNKKLSQDYNRLRRIHGLSDNEKNTLISKISLESFNDFEVLSKKVWKLFPEVSDIFLSNHNFSKLQEKSDSNCFEIIIEGTENLNVDSVNEFLRLNYNVC